MGTYAGQVLVAGGMMWSAQQPVPLYTAELYDPAHNTWTQVHSLVNARYSHNAVLLPAGQVLVMGGVGSTGALDSYELYDPAAGANSIWTPSLTNTFTSPRSIFTSTLISPCASYTNGCVLSAGGSDNTTVFDTTELYTW
jgi:hypothetical protein